MNKKKHDLPAYYLQETHVKFKKTNKLKVKLYDVEKRTIQTLATREDETKQT